MTFVEDQFRDNCSKIERDMTVAKLSRELDVLLAEMREMVEIMKIPSPTVMEARWRWFRFKNIATRTKIIAESRVKR